MNEKLIIKRVYHPFNVWEDYKNGFYNNCTGKEKESKIKSALEMFNDSGLTSLYMNKVIEEWKYSCEHNLTNDSMNKIAYIGQAACCIYDNIPNTVTMEVWSMLDKEVQDRSNNIAEQVIEKWKSNNKLIQLCLNFD